jgi:hypothetical protein
VNIITYHSKIATNSSESTIFTLSVVVPSRIVSAITLAELIALLLVLSARLVDLVRADEKALKEVEAIRLAKHLGQLPSLTDAGELERVTELVRATRLDVVGIRIRMMLC